MTAPYCQACLATDALPSTDRCRRCTRLDLPRAADLIAEREALQLDAAVLDELHRIKAAQRKAMVA